VLIVAAQNHLSKTTLGDDDDDESDAEPGLSDYVMHYLTLPWKVSINDHWCIYYETYFKNVI